MVFNILKNNAPSNLYDKFHYANETHNVRTRVSLTDLRLPKVQSELGKTKLSFCGAMLFNSLPNHVKDTENISISAFKNSIKSTHSIKTIVVVVVVVVAVAVAVAVTVAVAVMVMVMVMIIVIVIDHEKPIHRELSNNQAIIGSSDRTMMHFPITNPSHHSTHDSRRKYSRKLTRTFGLLVSEGTKTGKTTFVKQLTRQRFSDDWRTSGKYYLLLFWVSGYIY